MYGDYEYTLTLQEESRDTPEPDIYVSTEGLQIRVPQCISRYKSHDPTTMRAILQLRMLVNLIQPVQANIPVFLGRRGLFKTQKPYGRFLEPFSLKLPDTTTLPPATSQLYVSFDLI